MLSLRLQDGVDACLFTGDVMRDRPQDVKQVDIFAVGYRSAVVSPFVGKMRRGSTWTGGYEKWAGYRESHLLITVQIRLQEI